MPKQKKISRTEVEKSAKKIKELMRERERRMLLERTEALIPDKFSDENIDKENEKRFLTDYRRHNPKSRFIVSEIQPYAKKFPLEFYRQIYRIMHWKTDGDRLYNRPGVVGRITNDIIYGRFPDGILKTLQVRNPLLETGGRLHKHFQWLTLIGEADLKTYIEDAIRIMTSSRYWAEFKRKYAKEFGMPYQSDMFEE